MIYKKLKYLLIVLVGILFLLPLNLSAKDNGKNKRPVMAKTQGSQVVTTRMDINNLNALEANNGYSDYNLNSNLEGTEYPKGSGKTAVFQSGFLWGGFIPGDAQVRVGGSAYRTGLQPGPIINGAAADPTSSKYSIYRVRPDVYPGGPSVDLSSDAALEGLSEATLLAQYQSDWTNWPAAGTANDLGAPFKDVNGDGKYEPGIDIPGVPGADQTIFYVANDLSTTQVYNLYGAKPLGLELHATFWAYAQAGAVGNMYFKKWELINKGTSDGINTIDSMFVSFWADVDLGASGDDLVGCDTTLSLQYCYNGGSTDAVYAPLPPPADGFDFFQGPVVKGSSSDVAIFNGKYKPGYRNLPMTAAYFFVNGDANFGDPPQGDPSGSTQFYHFFNGEYGLSGTPFVDPNGNLTKFAFSGDPVTQTGWIDGVDLNPGDRRQGMASGPFTLAPNDTQEVVVAEIFAGAVPGVNYLQAVTLLKTYDKTAQNAYDHFFNLPSAPPAPRVTAIGLDKKVSLDWGEDLAAVNATENSVIADQIDSVDANGGGSYKFQGYNIYQFPYRGASIDAAKLIATYDIIDQVATIPYTDPATRQVEYSISIQHGTDSGIKRFMIDSVDVFNSNKPLNNGTSYYFAVTAYSYNPLGVPQSLENPISMVTVIPKSTSPGVRNTYNAKDVIAVNHASGASDGQVAPYVVDPTKLSGDQYRISFTNSGGDTTASAVADGWNLYDVTKNNKLLYTSTNLSGSIVDTLGSGLSYPTVDGYYLTVQGPPIAVNTATTTGTRWVGATNGGYEAFGGGLTMGANWNGSDLPASQYVPVILKFVGGPDSSTPSLANGWSQGAVYRRDKGYAYEAIGWMPFTAWDISNPSKPRQINCCFVEDPRFGSANLQWDMGWDGTSFPDVETGGREYVFVDYSSYDPNHYNATINGLGRGTEGNDVLYALWPDPRVLSSAAKTYHPYLEGNWTMTIVPNYPILIADKFTFTATAPSSSTALAKQDINAINVFPNPYYGVNSQETTKYAKFVTFNHLPASATIRIFNLAGIQVRVLNHTDGTQFQQWDLNNESGLPVASGLYIVYVDMPGIGATKILKAAIIQEQQFPDHF